MSNLLEAVLSELRFEKIEKRKASFRDMRKAAQRIRRRHNIGRDMDYGFDCGEWSESTHDDAEQREIEMLCQKFGWDVRDFEHEECRADNEEYLRMVDSMNRAAADAGPYGYIK